MVCADKNIIQTRKKDKLAHGIGLHSVDIKVDKYNGIMDINYDEGEFRVAVILYI